MNAELLNGRMVAAHLRPFIKHDVELLSETMQRPLGLAVILIGQDPASEIYVKNKCRACLEVGIHSMAYDLGNETSEKQLLNLIDELNKSDAVDGILVQLPLPLTINTDRIIESLHPVKDVDGFHPCNLGRLAQRNPLIRPCTPFGIIQLLNHYQIPLKGKHAVVVGASNIVGRPLALEFLMAGATVTICHRFTSNLERHIRNADIVVLAAGKMDLVKVEWLNESQIIVDVGIHRLDSGEIRGDIDFTEASGKVAWITPVPGGVGPMTISALLQNTVSCAKLRKV